MNYYLFKLKFDTAVHFGGSDSALSLYTSEDHFYADTLFSALCHTALSMEGPEGAEALCRQAEAGELVLSDSMPWKGDALYLPKPFLYGEGKQETPPRLRKAMKKLAWLPVEAMGAFSDSIRGGEPFDAEQYDARFGISDEMTKARIGRQDGEDTLPYQVGVFRFAPDCGLWFIAGCQTEEQGEKLEKLVTLLGLGGLGGKVTAGYGKFQINDYIYLNEPFDGQTSWLYEGLCREDSSSYLLLTTSLPSEEELDELIPDATFQLTRRGGFVQSASNGAQGRKKRTQYFLSAGSMLPSRFRGQLYEVGEGASHSVVRFSSPVLLGVSL